MAEVSDWWQRRERVVAEDVARRLQRERAPSSVKQFHAELVCPDAWHSCISCARAISLLYTHAQRQRSPGVKQQVGHSALSLACAISPSHLFSRSLSRACSLSLSLTHTHLHTHTGGVAHARLPRGQYKTAGETICVCASSGALAVPFASRARSSLSLSLSLSYTHTHTNTHTQTQTRTQTRNRSAKL